MLRADLSLSVSSQLSAGRVKVRVLKDDPGESSPHRHHVHGITGPRMHGSAHITVVSMQQYQQCRAAPWELLKVQCYARGYLAEAETSLGPDCSRLSSLTSR